MKKSKGVANYQSSKKALIEFWGIELFLHHKHTPPKPRIFSQHGLHIFVWWTIKNERRFWHSVLNNPSKSIIIVLLIIIWCQVLVKHCVVFVLNNVSHLYPFWSEFCVDSENGIRFIWDIRNLELWAETDFLEHICAHNSRFREPWTNIYFTFGI